MKPLYNLAHPNAPITKGLVEIINLRGRKDWCLAVDGVIVSLDADDIKAEIFNKYNIKEMCKISGVTEDKLHFVIVDLYSYSYKIDSSHDFCHVDVYDDLLDFTTNKNFFPASETQYVIQGLDNYYNL